MRTQICNLITEHAVGVYGFHFGGRDSGARFYIEVALNKEEVSKASSPAELVELLRQALWALDYSIMLTDVLEAAVKSGFEPTVSPDPQDLADYRYPGLAADLEKRKAQLAEQYPTDYYTQSEILGDYAIRLIRARSRN